MFSLRNTLAAASLLIGATTSAAFAATWPATLAGSTWQGTANGSDLTLTIKTQSGGGTCATITGTFSPASVATGYYCPSSGSVVVFRSSNNEVFQVFSGSISQLLNPAAIQPELSGTFGQYYDTAITGFYPFALTSTTSLAAVRR